MSGEKTGRSVRRFWPLALLALAAVLLGAALWPAAPAGSGSDWEPFPAMPPQPETGVWYQLDPAGAVSANGTPWHGDIRIGRENKVIVYFFGGGIALDEYTAAHSYSVSQNDGFYFDSEGWIMDYLASWGIGSDVEGNPFRDWSVIAVPYTTGDLHIGSGDMAYTAADGSAQTARFRGYDNYRAMMAQAVPYVGSPDQLLIAGTSAGGFGAALLAEDVMGWFPETEDVTVCVDSAFLINDAWPETARTLWQAPESVTGPLTSNNLLLDPLLALYAAHGDRVKLLYTCSIRDGELSRFQSYIDTGTARRDDAAGDVFQGRLREMVRTMETEIPTAGFYLWDGVAFKDAEDTNLTRHTTLVSGYVFDELAEETRVVDWLYDAVEGDVRTYGLSLLEPKAE